MDIRVAGIDYSMTNPAVCLYAGNSFSFERCEFMVMTDVNVKGTLNNVQFTPHPNWRIEIERFHNISDRFYTFIDTFKPDYVGIEGYSMGSRGKVFNIAENTALLKHRLFLGGYKLDIIAPTTIKKFATNSGRADKQKMVETFQQTTKINLGQTLFQTPDRITSPISDIVDSYYIAKYIFDRYK